MADDIRSAATDFRFSKNDAARLAGRQLRGAIERSECTTSGGQIETKNDTIFWPRKGGATPNYLSAGGTTGKQRCKESSIETLHMPLNCKSY
jgi:hypothetical protein